MLLSFLLFNLLVIDLLYPMFEVKYSFYMSVYELQVCVSAFVLIYPVFSEIIFFLALIWILNNIKVSK